MTQPFSRRRALLAFCAAGLVLPPAPLSAQAAEPAEHDALSMPVQVGAGSHRGWNGASVALEHFPLGQDHISGFLVAGAGTIMAGAGVALYTDRYGPGLVASAVGGLAGAHVTLGGQLRLGSRGYLVGGIGYGSYFLQYHGVLPYLSWEYRF